MITNKIHSLMYVIIRSYGYKNDLEIHISLYETFIKQGDNKINM